MKKYLDCNDCVAWRMPHFDNMSTRAKAQLTKVLQIMDAAVILLLIDSDNACEFDDLLQPGFNLCLFGVG